MRQVGPEPSSSPPRRRPAAAPPPPRFVGEAADTAAHTMRGYCAIRYDTPLAGRNPSREQMQGFGVLFPDGIGVYQDQDGELRQLRDLAAHDAWLAEHNLRRLWSTASPVRLWVLERGGAIVAFGALFPDGQVAMRWNSLTAQTALFANTTDVISIHDHARPDGAATTIRFLDGQP